MKWVRAGGAISKRSVSSREADAQPPHQLINDMCELDEGMRQLAMVFQQTRAIQAVQLRTILSKLMLRGLLSPESANYISSLPPGSSESSQQAQQQQSASNAGLLGGGAHGMSYGGGGYGSCGSGLSRASPLGPMGGGSFAMSSRIDSGSFAGENQLLAQLGAAGSSGAYGRISIGSQSFEGLQAQWDALDAGTLPGITGITSSVGGKSGFNLGGSNSGSDSGDSMQPFFEIGGPSSGSASTTGSTQGSSTRQVENVHDATSQVGAY